MDSALQFERLKALSVTIVSIKVRPVGQMIYSGKHLSVENTIHIFKTSIKKLPLLHSQWLIFHKFNSLHVLFLQ